MTITPVAVGGAVCAWAADEFAMDVAPIRARVSAKTRSAFVVLVSAIIAGFLVLGCRELAAFLAVHIEARDVACTIDLFTYDVHK
jgi:hypothetical protein